MLNFSKQKLDRKQIIWDYFSDDVWFSARILDCASGDGRKGLQYYLTAGVPPRHTVAVDKNVQLLQILGVLGASTHCLDLEKVKVCDCLSGDFNMILCAETLEHLTQKAADRLLNSFLCLLAKKGHLVLTFPVNVITPKNRSHIRQPSVPKLLEKLLPLFEDVEMRKYSEKTYMIFCTGKKWSV